MMRISTWPVFFKYSSPLTTSSCFSSFSPSIKVSLVPIHIYPPFFHTSCIFQQIFQQIFLRPSLVASPTQPSHHPSSGRRKWSTEPPNIRCLQSGAWMTEAGQIPQQNRWIYGWTSHSTESHHKIPMSFVVFVVSKRWPKCSPRSSMWYTFCMAKWGVSHPISMADISMAGSWRPSAFGLALAGGGSGDSASGWNMVKQHQMGG